MHIQSKIELLEDTAKLKWILATMTAQQETVSDTPWSLEDAPTAYIDAMCRGIIGFRFAIDSVQAQFKLSQNKIAGNIAGVTKRLRAVKYQQCISNGRKSCYS